MIEFDYNRYPLISILKKAATQLIKNPSKKVFANQKREIDQ
jgi:hypothetical protein